MSYVKKPSWGTKRICPNCTARYYDLGHVPIICPKCQSEYVEVVRLKSAPAGYRSGRGAKGLGAMRSFPAVAEDLPETAEREDPEAETEAESDEEETEAEEI